MSCIRSLLKLSAVSLALLSGMSHADEATQILRGVLGAIANEQLRQQPQTRQQRQPQAQRQQQRQLAAPQPSRARASQPRMSLDERKALQRTLAAEGFYQGAIDGDLGPASRRAIANWQASMGAESSGYLRPRQAQALIRQAPAANTAQNRGAVRSGGWSDYVTETPSAGFPAARATTLVAPTSSGELFPVQPSATAGSADDAATSLALAADPPTADAPTSQQVVKQMLFWAIGQMPGLPWNDEELLRYFQRMPELRDPEGGQIFTQNAALLREGLESLAAQAREKAVPSHFVTEIPVQLGNRDSDTPYQPDYFPDLAGTFGMFGQQPAVTRLELRGDRDLRGYTGHEEASVKLRLAQPFYLPLPEDIEGWYFQRDRNAPTATAVLRLVVALSDHRVEADGLKRLKEFASATASVQSATLVLRQQDKQRNILGERELMRWDEGEAVDDAIERPQTAEQIAALYGTAWQDDRVVISPPEGINALTYVRNPILGLANSSSGNTGERLLTALRLGAVLDATPDRSLDLDYAQQQVAPLLLTSPEFAEIYPLDMLERGDNRRKMDEFERMAALTGGDPLVRAKVMARLPELPLKLRHVERVRLQEYDFERRGFPLLDARVKLPAVGNDYESETLPTPSLLAMDEDSARQLRAMMRGVADTYGGDVLFLVVDYAVTHISAPPGSGPVQATTLATARTRHEIDAMALYADPGLSMKVRDLPIPEGHSAEDNDALAELPPEVHASNWSSLVASAAAVAAQSDRGRELLEQGYFDTSESEKWTGQDREQRLTEARAAMIASAMDSHWLLARMELSAYDPAAGGFAAQLRGLEPASEIDSDAFFNRDTPQLAPAVPADYALLRVPPDQADAVSALLPPSGRIGLLLKAPIAPMADGDMSLRFGAPQAAIFGPRNENGARPDFMVLQVALQSPDRTTAMAENTGAALTAPETLVLDGEGVDLLALSLNPALYDEAAFMRMMIARYSLEALVPSDGTGDRPMRDLPWGRFFKDTNQQVRLDELQAILPMFREWTLARAAMLPDHLLLPVSDIRERHQAHPATACLPMQEVLRRNSPSHFMISQAATILGDEAAISDTPLNLTAPRASVGPDRVWTYADDRDYAAASCARPKLPVSGAQAKELRDGGFVGVLVHVPSQPILGRQAEMEQRPNGGSVDVRVVGAASYVLKREEARLVDVSALPDRPEMMASVLVLRGSAIEARTYGDGSFSGPADEVLDRYGPEQWGAAAVTAPAATDLLGMTLGMPLAAFQEQVAQRLPAGQDHLTKIPGEGLFGHARFRHDPATGEVIGAVYAPDAEGNPVIALMRWLELPLVGGASPEALEASLVQKYGPVQERQGEGDWIWGALPRDLDYYGFCGGGSTFKRLAEQVPTLEPAEGQSRGAPGWMQSGWPATVTRSGGPFPVPDPDECGPVVTAWARKSAETLVAQIWLMDRSLAGELAEAAPSAPTPLDIEF